VLATLSYAPGNRVSHNTILPMAVLSWLILGLVTPETHSHKGLCLNSVMQVKTQFCAPEAEKFVWNRSISRALSANADLAKAVLHKFGG
jgi:hypothetical protein